MRIDSRGRQTAIALNAALDHDTFAGLRRTVAWYGRSSGRITIDLRDVPMYELEVLGRLQDLVAQAIEGGWGLEIHGAPSSLRRALDDAGLSEELPLT